MLRAMLAGAAAALAAGPALADPAPGPSRQDIEAQIQALKSDVRGIDEKIAALEAEAGTLDGGAPRAAPAPAAKPQPEEQAPTSAAIARIDTGKPVIESADGRFAVNLIGVMQVDGAGYFQAPAGSLDADFRRGGSLQSPDLDHARDLDNGTDVRRARIGLAGDAFGDFEYSLLYDFGGTGVESAGHIQELWLQYSGLPHLHLRVGVFAPSIGLEDAGSTNAMLFLERPAISDLARSVAAGGRRQGAALIGEGSRWFVSGAVVFNQVATISTSTPKETFGDPLSLVARAAFVPIESKSLLLHLGVHGSYVARPVDAGGPETPPGGLRYPIELRQGPELGVDGTKLIDTSQIDAAHAATLGAEVAVQHRNLFVQGEYERIVIDRRDSALPDPSFSGWYLEAGWVVTGEARRYNSGNFAFDGPAVRTGFDPRRGAWGAVELALRYSVADLNFDAGAPGSAPAPEAVRGGDQKILTAGVNWYLNSLVRLMVDYQHVSIDRLSPDATIFQTPAGAQIGQTYDVGDMRVQLAF